MAQATVEHNDSGLSRRRLFHSVTGTLRSEGAVPDGVPAVSGTCRHHRVCAAVCPEKALRAYEIDGRSGIALDLTLCTGCGRCVTQCPEKAIALGRRPEDVHRRVVPLTAHRLVPCPECDDPFLPDRNQTICPACRKSQRLFGWRAAASTAVGPTLAKEEKS